MSYNQQLQREIKLWRDEGIISAETETTLLHRYPVVKKSMTQTLALLGSLLFGIGVILFFSANWEVMPRTLKVAVVVLSFTLSYGAGYYLRYYKATFPKVGFALICLGSLLYGAAIWLIAQIFHLPAETEMGFFLWYLGVIPVAYLFNSSINLTLALVNLVVWFLAGKYPLSLPFIIFPVLLGSTILPLAIKKKDLINFVLAIVAAYIWFVPLGVKLAHTNFSFQLGITGLLLFSLLLYNLARLLKNRQFFAENFLDGLTLLGLFVGLAPFSFHGFINEFATLQELFYFPFLLGAVILVIAGLKLKSKTLGRHDLPLFLLYLCLFPLFPALGANTGVLILNNLLLFIYALLAVYYGYLLKNPFIFNLSIIMFAAAVVMKYFDFFFAVLPRSAFFITGGLLLLLGSLFLENKRRNLLKTMERGEQ